METSPTTLESEGTSSCAIHYSESVAKRIASLYAEGNSLHKISQHSEMPVYATMLRWAKEHPEFRQMIEGVRAQRALHFEDKAIETAENAEGKDGDRLRFDAYKWGAEVNDPTRYGKKVTHGGDPDRPITFIVATGFPMPNEFQRPPTLGADGLIEKARHVEAEVVDDSGRRNDGAEVDRSDAGGGREGNRLADDPPSVAE